MSEHSFANSRAQFDSSVTDVTPVMELEGVSERRSRLGGR
jgi:hypothetical protein